MKKYFLMLAAAALMVSCTGNADQANEEKDSTANATEQKEEKKAEEQIKGPATIDNPTWTIEVPAGWVVESQTVGKNQKGSSYLRMKPEQRPEGAIGLVGVKVSSYPYKSNTVEQTQETFKKAFSGVEEAGTETINGVKFKKLVKPEGKTGGIITHLAAPLDPEGNVSIEIQGYKLDDEAMKAMLNSFKLKPAEAEAK